MSDKFDELFEKMGNSGVDEDLLSEFRSHFEASPLRTELKATKAQVKELWDKNRTLSTGLLNTQFDRLGIKIKPSALNIPDDLDPSDPEKVTTWATEMGLYSPPPTTDPSQRAAHDRISQASNEGGNTTLPSLDDLDPTKLSEDEFYKKAEILSRQRREAASKVSLDT